MRDTAHLERGTDLRDIRKMGVVSIAHMPGRSVRTDHAPTLRLSRVGAVLFALIYPLSLIWTLESLIAPVWTSYGYAYSKPSNLIQAALTILVAVAPSVVAPLNGRRPSTAVLWLIYVMVYVPMIIVPVYSLGYSLEQYLPFQVFSLGCFLLLLLVRLVPLRLVPRVSVPDGLFWAGIAALSILFLALIVRSFGLPTHLPSFSEVYDVRSDFAADAEASPVASLAMSWQSKVLNPLLICYGVVRRRPMVVAVGVGGQFLLYAFAGHKFVVLSGVLVVALLFALVKGGRLFGPLVVAGATLVVLASAAIELIAGTGVFVSLFVRRLLLTSGLLTGYYFDFFTSNPLTQDMGFPFNTLFDSPYAVHAKNLIGQVYFGRVEMSANAHFWIDSFAAFSYIGMLIATLVVMVIMWMYDSLSLNRDYRLAAVLAGISAFSLSSSGLTVSLITHGIVFSLVILYLLPTMREERFESEDPR